MMTPTQAGAILTAAAERPVARHVALPVLSGAISHVLASIERSGGYLEREAAIVDLAAGDPALWLAVERECGVEVAQ